AHLKFGTVSVREVFYRISEFLGDSHELLRQLYWRDFFTHVAWHFPHVFGHNFRHTYATPTWIPNDAFFECWCRGRTGFPIVDAGMRELNQTGFMHNRVRMIAASFLVKDLHIDWRRGELYFAQHLMDYDPAINNGNWQWAASTGCDAQPWFRIFNPWRQQIRFDPEAEYCKKWVPELLQITPADINKWNEAFARHPGVYVPPMVDHAHERKATKEYYRAVSGK
ncbi:MAG: deoxyribodipyrimidine photo-lyase, partial [Chitinivibrionales bacterium]|nr:deoxyribodipyrimidine photo-lyase [Chitinivibrionales bacterium]